MRTLLRVICDTPTSNRALADGSLQEVIQSTMERLKPEAAYFLPSEGHRSCIMVFDMKDPSEIPSISEPFFTKLNARVEITPAMNVEDMQRGLQKLQRSELALEQ